MKHVLFCFSLLLVVNAMAQKPEWGRLMTAENKDYTPTIVGEDNDAFYTVDFNTNWLGHYTSMLFEKYDKRRMNQKYSKEIPIPATGGRDYTIEKVTFLGDKFMVFGSYYDNSSREYELRLFTYSAKNARQESDFEIYKAEVEKRRRKGDFTVKASKNKETFVVHYHTYYREKDQTVEIIKLYDKNIGLIVDKDYVADGDVGGTMSGVVVDDEGSIYFVRNGESVVILDANAEYEAWSEPIVVDGMEANGSLRDFFYTLNADNDLVVVSNYLTTDLQKTDERKRRKDRKRDDTQVEGIFYMRINGFTKETEASLLSKFDQDYIDQFRTARDIKKDRDAEMNDEFGSSNFYFKDDGGVVFVAEKQYMIQYQRDGVVTGEKYYYEDLVTFNFDANGELVWAHRIPKSQTFYWSSLALGFNATSVGLTWFNTAAYARGYFSYVAGITEDKFYIIYNDEKRNVNVQDENSKIKSMTAVKRAVPVVYEIDLETGVKEKNMALSFTSGSAHFKPNVNYQASQTEPLYIFSMKKKSFRFGKVDFTNQEGKGRDKRARR